MKVLRTICPQCDKERRLTTESDDLSDYQEEIVHERCPNHIPTAESRLLDAIFGEEESK